MSSEWIKEIEMIKMKIEWLKLFSAEFWDSNKFREYIHQLDKHLENYEEIMIIGHFDSAFSNLVEKYYPKFRNCVMKVISHKFPKKDRTNRNRRGLEAMSRAGVDVKVNDDVHARMFIGYHSSYPTSELVIGFFDFNRDGMSYSKKMLV